MFVQSWNEVKEFVRGKYRLTNEGDEHFAMVFEFSNKRSQMVLVQRVVVADTEWCTFASAFCKDGEMAQKVALKRNNDFLFGAIAQDGEFLVFKYTIARAALTPASIDLTLQSIARVADKLEETYIGTDTY